MEVMVKPAKLQPFLGERDHRTVLAWLFEAEAKVRHYAGSDVEAVHVSASYFRGDALNWWRVLSERAALPGSWTEFSQALRDQFLPADYARRARDELYELKQMRSVAEYVTRFRGALLSCEDVSPAEAYDRFRRGLKPRVAYEVLRQSPDSLETAIVLALRAEDAMQGSVHYTTRAYGGVRARNPGHPVPMEIGNVQTFPRARWYACGEEGHFKRNCSKKATSGKSGKEASPRGALGRN